MRSEAEVARKIRQLEMMLQLQQRLHDLTQLEAMACKLPAEKPVQKTLQGDSPFFTFMCVCMYVCARNSVHKHLCTFPTSRLAGQNIDLVDTLPLDVDSTLAEDPHGLLACYVFRTLWVLDFQHVPNQCFLPGSRTEAQD